MEFHFDLEETRDLIRQVVGEVLVAIDWPVGRLALTELEAAQACGVARHVLRDFRLRGKIQARRLGKRVIYLRPDLLAALGAINCDAQNSGLVNNKSSRKRSQ